MREGRLCEGLRVIDAASCIAGPVATTILADFGADVVKIEILREAGYAGDEIERLLAARVVVQEPGGS